MEGWIWVVGEREIEIERGGEMEWEGEMEGWMDKGVYQGSE